MKSYELSPKSSSVYISGKPTAHKLHLPLSALVQAAWEQMSWVKQPSLKLGQTRHTFLIHDVNRQTFWALVRNKVEFLTWHINTDCSGLPLYAIVQTAWAQSVGPTADKAVISWCGVDILSNKFRSSYEWFVTMSSDNYYVPQPQCPGAAAGARPPRHHAVPQPPQVVLGETRLWWSRNPVPRPGRRLWGGQDTPQTISRPLQVSLDCPFSLFTAVSHFWRFLPSFGFLGR